MKCPLCLIFDPPSQLGVESDYSTCLQEECAWWDEEKQACSVKVIAKELTRIQLKTGDK